MDTITVRALMSSPVITVAPHTPLPQLRSLLREHTIRRLPVVDRQQLVGIITISDVRSAFPTDATTLSIYELSYLLSNVTAAEIMRRDVITIAADASLAEAIQHMLSSKVSSLPVLDNDQIVGMLTESDIFRAVIAGQVPLVSARTSLPPASKPVRLNV